MGRGRVAVALLVGLTLLGAAPAAFGDTLQLAIQPIQVCDDLGVVCAHPGRLLFSDFTRSIWLQAGVWFTALGWQSVFSATLLEATVAELASGWPRQPGVLNVWFVEQVLGCGGVEGAYGCGVLGGNGIAIADRALADGRMDVLAHEIGHNLGLGHVLDPRNLMAAGENRLVPARVEDVYPFGTVSGLDAQQIARARSSPLLVPVPEPGSLLLVLAGLTALAARAQRGRSSRPMRCRKGERKVGRHVRRAAPPQPAEVRRRACGRPPCGRSPAR